MINSFGSVQKSRSSKAAALFARGAYWQYVSTEKGRERRWRLFSTDPSKIFKFYNSIGLFLLLNLFSSPSWASDPFGNTSQAPKPNSPRDLALDQVNWNRIQGVFSWITMARGFSDTPWESSEGRPGWRTMEDAYVRPIDPGVSEFPIETETFYIVFEGQPLDAPAQFAAAWFELKDGEIESETPVDKDVIELDMNQRFGYFEIYQPEEGWKAGNYLVKIYYGSPGQDLHAINVVGTMQFTIK